MFYNTERQGPAASFNIGASHSQADWLLYVDPHVIYAPKAIHVMQKTAKEDYELVLGSGYNTTIDPHTPWGKALGDRISTNVPLTFLIRRDLWQRLGGIPEPPYCHMDVLGDFLTRKGVLIGEVKGVCVHDYRVDLLGMARTFFSTGLSYGVLAREGYQVGRDHRVVQMVEAWAPEHVRAHVSILLQMLFASCLQLGALTGLERVPQEALGLEQINMMWRLGKEKEDTS